MESLSQSQTTSPRLEPLDLDKQQDILFGDCHALKQLYHKHIEDHDLAFEKAERRLKMLTIVQERAKTLLHDSLIHREIVIGPIAKNLLILKAQALEAKDDGALVVAHMELYHLELEVLRLFRIEKKREHYLAIGDRLLAKFKDFSTLGGQLKSEMNDKLESIYQLANRTETFTNNLNKLTKYIEGSDEGEIRELDKKSREDKGDVGGNDGDDVVAREGDITGDGKLDDAPDMSSYTSAAK